MEQGYLIDSNTAIDYLDNKLSDSNAKFIDGNTPKISVISRMEILGWAKASIEQAKVLKQFVGTSVVFNLEESIILKTIELRKAGKIKLPDAIIAATALIHNLTLLTGNTVDFKNIPGLRIIDTGKV